MTEVSARDPDRLYDGNFWLAMFSQTCFVIANTLMAHYARWIEFLGGSLTQVGLIMGAGASLGLLLRPWLAQWINRLGARSMWLCGYAMFSIAALSNLALDDTELMIYACRALQVLGTAVVFTSGLTYVSQTSPDHRRTEAIGIFGIGGFLGMLLGPALGDLFLAQRERESFELLFLVAAAANLLPAIGLCLLRPTDSEGTGSSLRLSEFASVTRKHWPGTILLVDFTFGVCMSVPFVFIASFIDEASLQLPGISVIGLFFACYAGMGITVRLTSRRVPDRIGPERVLLLGLIFMTVGMSAYSIVDADATWRIVIPAVLAGTGHGLMFHTMTSLTLEPFPHAVRGTGSALALMMLDGGTLAGAPVLGVIGDRYGFTALFGSVAALCAATAVVYGVSHLRGTR